MPNFIFFTTEILLTYKWPPKQMTGRTDLGSESITQGPQLPIRNTYTTLT